jgi:hypothetical protein
MVCRACMHCCPVSATDLHSLMSYMLVYVLCHHHLWRRVGRFGWCGLSCDSGSRLRTTGIPTVNFCFGAYCLTVNSAERAAGAAHCAAGACREHRRIVRHTSRRQSCGCGRLLPAAAAAPVRRSHPDTAVRIAADHGLPGQQDRERACGEQDVLLCSVTVTGCWPAGPDHGFEDCRGL